MAQAHGDAPAGGRRGNPPVQVSRTSTVAGEALGCGGPQVSYRYQQKLVLPVPSWAEMNAMLSRAGLTRQSRLAAAP